MDVLARWRQWQIRFLAGWREGARQSVEPNEDAPPLRSELFGVVQLEAHARRIAGLYTVDSKPGPDRLLNRLRQNETVIRDSYRTIAKATREKRHVAPAAEWLLDNYYLIEEQIELARTHLPKSYSRLLPRLRTGPCQGLPRVYDLMLRLVSHTDGRVDIENLSRFVAAFQSVETLSLGELWAVPIMLRLTLIENLRRVAYRIAWRRKLRDRAEEWAQRFLSVAHSNRKRFIEELADFVRSNPPEDPPFVAELATSLEGQDPGLELVIDWLQQQLAERGQTLELVHQAESHEQAADQASIANTITTLRTTSRINWREFVESQSVTEAALRKDPVGVYPRMDFATRDRCRHVVERLAREAEYKEETLTETAVRLAERQRFTAGPEALGAHVGYYLIGEGRRELEREIGFRPGLAARLVRRLAEHALGTFLFAVCGLTALLALPVGLPLFGVADLPRWALATGLAAILIAMSRPAIRILEWIGTLTVPPRTLARLDFSSGIPAECRTAVVVPSLLTSENVQDLLDQLEIRFLANRSPNLLFGLLTDFPDASRAILPEDEELLHTAREGIRRLNARHADPDNAIFFLLHRPRLWNPPEGVWMAYERKRGKIEQFNRLVREGDVTPFCAMEADLGALRGIRFVLTLDTDTQLPPGSVALLVGTLAHPLNRPRLDPATRCVVGGYGVLQPRLGVSLPAARKSLFASLLSGEVGLDPYSREVSNFYHDLFGRGQFLGKGLYDVEAFDSAVRGRFPENRILSHDLIEGCHARCGFVSDVELIEDYPSGYLADMRRRHRWIRGDWQIARWLWPHVPSGTSRSVPNPLSPLSRWMIFDNLRRSLVPLSLVVSAGFGWVAVPREAGMWAGSLLGLFLLPEMARTVRSLAVKARLMRWADHLGHAVREECRAWGAAFLEILGLPYETCRHTDAILRSLWRLWVTRRGLLRWRTAAEADRVSNGSLGELLNAMSGSLLLAAGLGTLAVAAGGAAAPGVAGLVVLWLCSPLFMWRLSRTQGTRPSRLSAQDERELGALAFRTWMFYERYAGPDHNWLPPDNVQETEGEAVAARTSPTNIAMGLLSGLAACDLGFLPAGELLDRTARTFATLEKLKRDHGHFYNWYDTQSLQPLNPRYVSTVDSGNLLAALVTLRAGLLEWADAPPVPSPRDKGFSDILDVVLAESVPDVGTDGGSTEPGASKQRSAIRTLRERFNSLPGTTLEFARALAEAHHTLSAMKNDATVSESGRAWLAVADRHVESALEELTDLFPWLSVPEITRRMSPADSPMAAFLERLSRAPLGELAKGATRWRPDLEETVRDAGWGSPDGEALHAWLDRLAQRAAERLDRIRQLAVRCEELADMDMRFLYDPTVHLFRIGYNVELREYDQAHYDLLASESRLGSYVAVSRGLVPVEHWFHLGRLLAPGRGAPVMLSWSGSMFEYLMAELLMPLFEGTLLGESAHGVVARQIAYGASRALPWGISESGYNQVDAHMTYQYRAFGVPGLGLKRGLSFDLVIAPYATALALTIEPAAAAANLRRLVREGAAGTYGLYEAMDYTPQRVPRGERVGIVRSYMAHHSGMSLLAFDAVLCNQPMRRRFRADLEMRANELLLQERVPPVRTRVSMDTAHSPETEHAATPGEAPIRRLDTADTPIPEVHLLSNERYHVMVTNGGGGYSRWQNLALTRWREDVTRDAWGTFFYIRDVRTGAIWSATHHPVGLPFDRYAVNYSQGTAEFVAERHRIQTQLRIAVSSEDDLEIRRLKITNLSDSSRSLEITSYAEVVLADPASEATHRVFSGLFMQAEAIPEKSALVFARRNRSPDEKWPCLFHFFIHRGPNADTPSFQTSRERFIGRGRTTERPLAVESGGDLTATRGAPLDPIAAIRHRLVLEPGASVTLDAVFGVAATREKALSLMDKHTDNRIAERVFELTWTHSQVLLHHLKASESDALLYGRLAGSLLYANRRYRASPSLIARNRKAQSGLWSYSVSGDRPILLLRLSDEASLGLVRRMLQAHNYWKHKGLEVDLVILAEAYAGYRQSLFDAIMMAVHASAEGKMLDQPGGIFVRNIGQLTDEDRTLFQAAGRIVISDRSGTLESQIERHRRAVPLPPPLRPSRVPERLRPDEATLPPRQLVFENTFGGFTTDGREYVIRLFPGAATPAPWANVLANSHGFGSVITESGSSYTWAENAHEFRLTPWHNDPVSDPSGEACYIRDEETGAFWSPTPRPAAGRTPYVCRHGHGYSTYEHTEQNLASELHVFVATDAPVKCALLILRNRSDRPRRISVTGFCEWVLGERRDKQAMHVVTRLDEQTGAVFAGNAFNVDFPDRVAFFQCSESDRSLTCDRTEFLGRNGSASSPAAMRRERLSNSIGAGLDPCAAIQGRIAIPPHEERVIAFVLGSARSEEEARNLVRRFGGGDGSRQALEGVWEFWKRQLGGVYVETPDRSIDFLVNHWLLYQVLASRFWGRSGFYQSGGAYGFRDQLQDSLAFLYECPNLTRPQLLLCASRQFFQGDAQHWWHPPSGRGVRTRISDTALWLPYVISRYVETTGDTGVLDEVVPFLDGRALQPEEDSYYDLARISDQSATLYEHGARAIRHALRFGAHGLPLMGSGDWNDGMNLVGSKGKGESVWLGFFLHNVLNRFAQVSANRGDAPFAQECRSKADGLARALETEAWDGNWYRRAFFDDGTPLGSADGKECRIDSLPQSWAVLSGAGSLERRAQALRSAGSFLVDTKLKLVRLFTPPFDAGDCQPGYLRGYVPGVRENGGQYTHAGVWLALAMAEMGHAADAWQLVSFLNPIAHSDTGEAVQRYCVEPYVLAADVYTAEGHEGRGGWTWYTGSAGWLYQLLVGRLLGLRVRVDTLSIEPLFHPDWPSYTVHYRYRNTFYHIGVSHTAGGKTGKTGPVVVDDIDQPDRLIHLVDDGREHHVTVKID